MPDEKILNGMPTQRKEDLGFLAELRIS